MGSLRLRLKVYITNGSTALQMSLYAKTLTIDGTTIFSQ